MSHALPNSHKTSNFIEQQIIRYYRTTPLFSDL